jgi:hypothetical protein
MDSDPTPDPDPTSELDPAPNPTPDPDLTPFYSDLKDAKKIFFFFIFFPYNLPAGTLSLLKQFCVKNFILVKRMIITCREMFTESLIFFKELKQTS